MKVLASSQFPAEVALVTFMAGSMLAKSHLMVTLKQGILGTRQKFFKGDFKEMEIAQEEETSSDTGQRIKNAAIGTVLLGPVGLLGALIGGKKTVVKIRVTTKDESMLLLEMPFKECEKIFKELMDVDLKKAADEQLLKKS